MCDQQQTHAMLASSPDRATAMIDWMYDRGGVVEPRGARTSRSRLSAHRHRQWRRGAIPSTRHALPKLPQPFFNFKSDALGEDALEDIDKTALNGRQGDMSRRSEDWNAGLAQELRDPEFAREFLLGAVEESVPVQVALGERPAPWT